MKKYDSPDIEHIPDYEGNLKKAVQSAQAGTGVPPADFSSKAAEAKAAGPQGDTDNSRMDPAGPTSSLRGGTRAACSYGHPASARDGHLRNSGHSGAHRIGKRK